MSDADSKDTPAEAGAAEYVEDGKNKMIVKCKFCDSKILERKTASYLTQEVSTFVIELA